MSERRAFIDRSPGETRGVVTLDGQPERLLLRRDDDEPRLMLGARLVGRVASVEPALGAAFLDLGGGLEAMAPFKPEARPVRGASLLVEIRSEPRPDKLAVVRILEASQGAPRLVDAPPDLADVLRSIVRDTDPVAGRDARTVADEAEAEVLETIHPLPGGGSIAIEPTRALTAIDVDLGERKGSEGKRVTRQANLAAVSEAARLLRLKGLGGLIVLDLVGRGHDGHALMAAARTAFGPDNPGVAIGPVGRFGTMELSIPRRMRPLREVLCDPSGRPSARTVAQHLVRRLEDEARAQPGARLNAACAPEVAQAAAKLLPALAEHFGARFSVTADPRLGRDRYEVSAA